MWKKGQSNAVITDPATLHAGTCTKSRVITYFLDSSKLNPCNNASGRMGRVPQ